MEIKEIKEHLASKLGLEETTEYSIADTLEYAWELGLDIYKEQPLYSVAFKAMHDILYYCAEKNEINQELIELVELIYRRTRI